MQVAVRSLGLVTSKVTCTEPSSTTTNPTSVPVAEARPDQAAQANQPSAASDDQAERDRPRPRDGSGDGARP